MTGPFTLSPLIPLFLSPLSPHPSFPHQSPEGGTSKKPSFSLFSLSLAFSVKMVNPVVSFPLLSMNSSSSGFIDVLSSFPLSCGFHRIPMSHQRLGRQHPSDSAPTVSRRTTAGPRILMTKRLLIPTSLTTTLMKGIRRRKKGKICTMITS